MERITEIVKCETMESIPPVDWICSLPREKTLKLIFGNEILNQREKVWTELKEKLVGYQIGMHTIEPEINISKLITDDEIEMHQDFFERCAKDYRQLATKLIFELGEKLQLIINDDFPLLTFNPLKRDSTKSRGKVNEWLYFLHGFHCGFENTKTQQCIEVPLTFGFEFGELDPYFFTRFIKTTNAYQPLPVAIYEDYADGKQILEKMLAIGKFEIINSSMSGQQGIVVTYRDKIVVKIHKGN